MTLKIYLADLIYNTVQSNYVVPLNIGYLAAHAYDLYGKEIDIRMFKYPESLLKQLKSEAPHVLGLSNYSWNRYLNQFFLKTAKQIDENIVTIMGGPNVRTDSENMKTYMQSHRDLDYYVMHEGEVPFSNLVQVLLDNPRKHIMPVKGCAAVNNGDFYYYPLDFNKGSKDLNRKSPYLMGIMDEFLADERMWPLLETNRGCPYGCVYCEWGTAANSRIKQRPLDLVYNEMDYIARKSVGQQFWIFCDANFGIFERDIEIAKHIRKIREERGYPTHVSLWHSKNTSTRNIKIVEALGGMAKGYIAIQSSDGKVLENAGRGAINYKKLTDNVSYFVKRNLPVSTDLLMGLPGETKESHFRSICDAFDLGFTLIIPMNIRLLQGTKYETDTYREKYQVSVKYRPIFGAYGEYDGIKVMEIDESLRSTKDITEEELNSFKSLHWLLYFCWNSGIFRHLLNFARLNGCNPGVILDKLRRSKRPALCSFFASMLEEAQDELFETKEAMLQYFQDDEHFHNLVHHFGKLNFIYFARVLYSQNLFRELYQGIQDVIIEETKAKPSFNKGTFDKLIQYTDDVFCFDLSTKVGEVKQTISGHAAACIFNRPDLKNEESLTIRIARTVDQVNVVKHYLRDCEKPDMNVLLRFLEGGGLQTLTKKVELIIKE